MASYCKPFPSPTSLPKPLSPSLPFLTSFPVASRVPSSKTLTLTRAFYSDASPTLSPPQNETTPQPKSKPKPKSDPFEPDDIALLNERIRKELRNKDSGCRGREMDSKEAEEYIRMVKRQQQRGLQKLRGDAAAGGFGYRVDPYKLLPGDYVVHKKVGVGRFIAIKFDIARDSSEPMEYVFIEYGDGMAKLPVKQAARMLYRYNLCGGRSNLKRS